MKMYYVEITFSELCLLLELCYKETSRSFANQRPQEEYRRNRLERLSGLFSELYIEAQEGRKNNGR